MNGFLRQITYGVSLALAVFALSGCVTKQLRNDIKDHEDGATLYSSDVITAATITETGKANYSWVFIGNNFDYALTSGGGDFLRALVTGKIDKERIKISENGTFILYKGKNQFRGEIALTYNYRDHAERMFIMNDLKLSVWDCAENTEGAGACEIKLTDLAGTIHKKNSVPDGVFQFNHPIKIKFYTNNIVSAKRLLYPVAVATDVALSPLYLLSGAAVLAVYGAILLH